MFRFTTLSSRKNSILPKLSTESDYHKTYVHTSAFSFGSVFDEAENVQRLGQCGQYRLIVKGLNPGVSVVRVV